MKVLGGSATAGTLLAIIAIAFPLLALDWQDREGEGIQLTLYFSPDGPPRLETIQELGKLLQQDRRRTLDLRLLVADFSLLGAEPSPEFQAAIKAMRELVGPEFGLSLYDEVALTRAKDLGLERLPAWVIGHHGHFDVAYGSAPHLEVLFRCRK